MCWLSMIYDHYQPKFPPVDLSQPYGLPPAALPNPYAPAVPNPFPPVTLPGWPPPSPADELRQLIKEFREAVAAARVLDRLMKQPDCEDADKKKLEGRVAELEKRLDGMKCQEVGHGG